MPVSGSLIGQFTRLHALHPHVADPIFVALRRRIADDTRAVQLKLVNGTFACKGKAQEAAEVTQIQWAFVGVGHHRPV